MLWAAAARLLWPRPLPCLFAVKTPSLKVAAPTGAALGLLAGLTGTGGGIFLSPLILFLGWEEPRKTSGVAAAFILANSAAGLAGNLTSLEKLPVELPWFAGAVLIGAVAGTSLGVSRLPRPLLLQLLGVVLTIAGAKLLFT
ncbi:MAG TPA: TSUP family transporter [Caulobacteraceae bacterium]|nr:TSUP family transporter [Caulobacteraceae bacterium]